jgi:hypothetical protein
MENELKKLIVERLETVTDAGLLDLIYKIILESAK